MADTLHIAQLELSAFIGVPDEERETAQWLTADLWLKTERDFRGLGDDVTKTVDYFAVCNAVKAVVAERPRKLIETLAEDIAAMVLAKFAVRAVEVEVRKYVLRDTAHVAAKIRRER